MELLEKGKHLSLHMTPERKEFSKVLAEKIRPLTKQWHASEKGRQWHRQHAKEFRFGKWEKKAYICSVCDKKYETQKMSNHSFCSNNCKSANRRKSGIDDVKRNCERCTAQFTVNKYVKTRFCSRKCGSGRRKSKEHS